MAQLAAVDAAAFVEIHLVEDRSKLRLADVRRQAQARDEAWRAAYTRQTAEDAIAAGRWTSMPAYGPFLPAR